MPSSSSKVTVEELGQHVVEHDAWILLNGVVWDFSGFAAKHPGGQEIIESHLGKDGSAAYNEIHSPAMVLRYFGEERRVGEIEDTDAITFTSSQAETNTTKTAVELPPLESIVNLSQFEAVAERALSKKAWLYVSGATEDGHAHKANKELFRQLLFRPTLLKGVDDANTRTTFLGYDLSCPILAAPTSSIKLTHPDGEIAVAKGCQRSGVPAIVPSMSSFSASEVAEALEPDHPFFFQLYVHKDRAELRRLLDEVCGLGARAIMITADLPVLSKREAMSQGERVLAPPPTNTIIDPNLKWEDIKWIQNYTKLPVFVKGIQRAEDARRAYEIGCAGIYLSNHGGRALDTTPPGILVLLEIQKTCPEILPRMEVVVDGGIRRGSDVLKAICLGASAVCVGRPFLYALAYGEDGLVRAFEILKEELKIAMQLLGITNLSEAHLGYLNTSQLDLLLPSTKIHGPIVRSRGGTSKL
ncbi:hypothetical protein LTR84_003945 [Exophiala bonariae]|uniref:Cytochrome b2, mitochondrial n=1 Tax=Exophiala bonariae TaxID=1690606 RepID=A0AAV9N4X6_9EURO|nr:hypothetical protein LTR84_003945 [Exophiala bonariae]